MARKQRSHEPVAVRGAFRLQITEDGKVVGDSGWHTNQVTNLGFNNFLCQLLGASAGSSQIGFMALGTGTVPAAAATNLNGELDRTSSRAPVTFATSATSKTARFTATFNSASSFVSATANIANIGLFAASVVTVGTLFAGNTFASSSCATNQNVNATYDITFS